MTALAPVKCARCGHPFLRQKRSQKFCSQRCERGDMKSRRRIRQGPAMHACANAVCGKQFRRTNPRHRYCCNACRYIAFRATPPKPRTRLRCKYCRGRHMTSACPNPSGAVLKQYGTLGPLREYIPPPGVTVRIIHAPYAMHGDELGAWLRERRLNEA